MRMSEASEAYATPGFHFEPTPDLSLVETRERLSQSAIDGFFAITEKWKLTMDQTCELLGGVPRATAYKWKTAAGTRRQDELTRISYVIGIYRTLHCRLPTELADEWMRRPNDNFLFGGIAHWDLFCMQAFRDFTKCEVFWTRGRPPGFDCRHFARIDRNVAFMMRRCVRRD